MDKKTHLNERDVFDMISFSSHINNIKNILGRWKNYMDPREIKDTKTVITLMQKTWNGIVDRLDNEDCNKIYEKNKKVEVVVIDTLHKQLIETRTAKLQDKLFLKDNYYRLVEVVMFYNCANCTCQDKKCGIYSQFETNLVPTPVNEPDFLGKKCKYAYEDKRGLK